MIFNLSPNIHRLLWGILLFSGIVIVSLILYSNRPKGEDIVFISINYPRSEIHSINADGSLESRLAYHGLPIYTTGLVYDLLDPLFPSVTNHPGVEWFHSQPTWSPDGAQVLFTFSKGATTIYLMDADGDNLHSLATGWGPSWSPDGSKILFTSGGAGNSNIYYINKDGSKFTRITNGPFDNSFPDWSPNSDQIVFVSELDSEWAIYKMDVDGGNLTQLTISSSYYSVPTWSPDGSQIAFKHHQGGIAGTDDIFLFDSDGQNITRLTNNMEVSSSLTWSPNSAKIAFKVFQRDGAKTRMVLYVIDKDGKNLIRLSDTCYPYNEPTWSPDSSRIVFSNCRNNNSDLYIINADGTNLKQLTFGGASEYAASWRP